MSSAQELHEIYNELQGLPESLQKEITKQFARLTGLKQLTGETAIQRDSQRLDAKQRAYYRKMGLELKPEEDDPTITNILADTVTVASNNDQGTSGKQQPAEPTKPVVIKPPPASNGRLPVWAAITIGAAVVGGPAAGAIGYLLNQPKKSVTAIDSQERTMIELSVRD